MTRLGCPQLGTLPWSPACLAKYHVYKVMFISFCDILVDSGFLAVDKRVAGAETATMGLGHILRKR